MNTFNVVKRQMLTHEIPIDPDIKARTEYRIPRFRVSDQSSVEVFETTNAVSTTMAEHSFTQTDVEVSFGAGAFGVTGGAKAAYTTSERNALTAARAQQNKTMHINYNFPRAIVQLDAESLELTPECRADLDAIVDADSLHIFHLKYGQFFPTRVELGGRLYFSQETQAVQGSDFQSKTKAMKAAASLSFSSPYVQASASASHETATDVSKQTTLSRLDNAITWHANGGDPLLCNNPPAWCSTVASLYNWRVVKQSGFQSMVDLIISLKDCLKYKTKFEISPDTDMSMSDGDKPVTSFARFFLKTKEKKYLNFEQIDSNIALKSLLDDIMKKEKADPEYMAHLKKEGKTSLSLLVKFIISGQGMEPWVTQLVDEEPTKWPFQVQVTSEPIDMGKIKYNTPYQLQVRGVLPQAAYYLAAIPVMPGFYHNTCLLASTDADHGAWHVPPTFTFRLQSTNGTVKKGIIPDKTQVILEIMNDEDPLNPVFVGDTGVMFENLVGTKEYTVQDPTPALEFTLLYTE
ncbi:Membrane attack complex component/perforin [Sclerotinia borealis F-4128]|uniref:Membrane attack complex component/perforin n=1 Tax=Sclerotinia borealis (strain F-4128) TaxID=1432307 RepID=W9CNG9_SCLBF|nr:Membrane attack complex component/perforin [Sclerotinia borealis F-4128]